MHARIEQQQFARHRCGTIDQPDHRIGNLPRSAGPLQRNGPFVLALQQLHAALAGSARKPTAENQTRAHGIHPHIRCKHPRHVQGQGVERSFGGDVGGRGADPERPCHRRDVHDRPLGLRQLRRTGANHLEGPDQIHGIDVMEDLRIDPFPARHAGNRRAARIVHERVDASPAIDCGADHPAAGSVVGDVGPHHQRVGTSLGAGFGRCRGFGLALRVVDDDVVPAARQAQDRGSAHARGRPCHDGDLSLWHLNFLRIGPLPLQEIGMFVVALRMLFGDPTKCPGHFRVAHDRCKPHEWATRNSNFPRNPR